MNTELVSEVLNIILGLLAIYASSKYRKAMRVLNDIAKTIQDYNEAAKDNNITPEEAQRLISDLQRLVEDFRR